MDNSLYQQIILIANNAVIEFRKPSQDRLDFSEASLTIVEEILEELSDFIDSIAANEIENIVNLFSCYVLEVARREYGGQYCWHESEKAPMLVVKKYKSRISIMTVAKVRNRLLGDTADNIPFFYRGFADRIKQQETNLDVLYI